jgi:predicted DNA-binding protein (UPF0251 family)
MKGKSTNKPKAGRPVTCRNVQDLPKVTCFRPDGSFSEQLENVRLTVDELEAVRLADRDGLYQADAALQMGVSRQTFGRILESARKKVAEAIVDGKKLCIEGGVIRQECDSLPDERPDICFCTACGHEMPHLKGVPCRESSCPLCDSPMQRKGGCGSDFNQ